MNIKHLIQKLEPGFLWEHVSKNDPVSLVRSYVHPQDQEVIGLLVSCFSYGSQKGFMPFLRNVLNRIGDYPYETVLRFQPEYWSFPKKYRFHTGNDIINLMYGMSHLLRTYGSLESAYSRGSDIKESIETVHSELRGIEYPLDISKNFLSLLPLPSSGSACKRINMFFRWMIRKGSPDIGIWNKWTSADLIMPVDTHIFRIMNTYKIVEGNSCNWSYAESLTNKLKEYYPDDPTRMDVLLCNSGVLGLL